jgi:hypothetical protein
MFWVGFCALLWVIVYLLPEISATNVISFSGRNLFLKFFKTVHKIQANQ